MRPFSFAFFAAVVASQIGHVGEHVAQMVQIHVLGLSGPNARGIVGVLDIEWVHFAWNTWILVAVIALVFMRRRDPWLWAAAVLSVWHEAEHAVIMATYLSTGVAGSPGLLARGGALLGGLPLSRPDLHFLYNLVETVPLVVAFTRATRGAASTVKPLRRSPSSA